MVRAVVRGVVRGVVQGLVPGEGRVLVRYVWNLRGKDVVGAW